MKKSERWYEKCEKRYKQCEIEYKNYEKGYEECKKNYKKKMWITLFKSSSLFFIIKNNLLIYIHISQIFAKINFFNILKTGYF